jgi:acetyltransferase-like isoleucine patch superfamily enzyme
VSEFDRRILAKLRILWFAARHRAAFANLGRSAHLFAPYRIDGAAGIELGAGTTLQRDGWLYCVSQDGQPARLRIGAGCNLGYRNHITCVRDVEIGDHVLTANNVYIADNAHSFEDVTRPILQQPAQFKRAVRIGSGAWLGENVCVIGASVGRNSVIGANAVVTHDIPDYCVAVGIPACVIRRFNPARGEWVSVRGST